MLSLCEESIYYRVLANKKEGKYSEKKKRKGKRGGEGKERGGKRRKDERKHYKILTSFYQKSLIKYMKHYAINVFLVSQNYSMLLLISVIIR